MVYRSAHRARLSGNAAAGFKLVQAGGDERSSKVSGKAQQLAIVGGIGALQLCEGSVKGLYFDHSSPQATLAARCA